jgi:UDP:flavonoid glycosyltransferase YjiC (YdhE family)
MARDDAAVLNRMNAVLQYLRQPPLDRVTQIYGDADATLLTTFKELDHFPWRQAARYFGPWTVATGKHPEWPQGAGPRIYLYLKDCPALPAVLRWLAASAHPTLAYVETINQKLLAEINSPTLRIERDRLDMNRAARECDLAVCHAPHGTTAAMLLAGKPLMSLPIYLEQGLMAHNLCNIGAGVQAPAADPKAAVAQLEKFVPSFETHAPPARAFAEKYADYDPIESNERLLQAIESAVNRA